MGNGGLEPGLYESVVTEALAEQLKAMDPQAIEYSGLVAGELPDRLALVVSELVDRAVRGIPEADRSEAGSALVREVIGRLTEDSTMIDARDQVADPLRVLNAIGAATPAGTWIRHSRPLTPLLDTALLTGSPGEPNLLAQLRSEIPSSESIGVLVAFIRQTGVLPMLGDLRDHVASGRPLRVLTTTYTGSTEQRALDLLADIGAQIRVSYDEASTRLHAKSWLFERPRGMSTAFVGSSNMTHQAQVTGLEWNIRLSSRRNQSAVEKLKSVFESYWASGDFVPYDSEEFAQRTKLQRQPTAAEALFFDMTPHPFQRRMLEQLELARQANFHRNLVVAATGTGKTVLAAFDYKRLRSVLDSSRLLFVAHRKEILEQALHTFRAVLRDPSFGELWVGGYRPSAFSHVFASIQSLNTVGVEGIEPDHFDVVIIDEFHHAAADTYDRLLRRLEPRELVGLTATPERADGKSVFGWFDDRIAVELRLWDAIDQQRLVPFTYFGVDDGSDLRGVPRRGREYDMDCLGNMYTANSLWIDRVLREIDRIVTDTNSMTALGFCASVSHAEFTAAAFRRAGIPAEVLTGGTPTGDRSRILADLRAGRCRVVFSVDVLSEGVDIPEVDTIFMMRPTESATVFLQQLGRGLRRLEGKGACLVLDFIGQQVEGFRFDVKYRALTGGGRKELEAAVRGGFPYLPAGCQLVLEDIPQQRVLKSLKTAIPNTWKKQAAELALLSANADISLASYLSETGLELADVYREDRSWMELRQQAGLAVPTAGAHEPAMRRAVSRLIHVDDPLRLCTYRDWLAHADPPKPNDSMSERLLRMLVASVTRSIDAIRDMTLEQAADLVWSDARIRADLLELVTVLEEQSIRNGDAIVPLEGESPLPLQLHARYSRDEILAAAGAHKVSVRPPTWQTGVWFEPSINSDLLVFTLDKSAGSFSPTTRYRDYAISESLIHWESQSVTRESSETGQRYINHKDLGSSILLFARATTNDRFWFLGPATYVSHVGERPMAVTWRLHTPLPETLYTAMAAAVA